MTADLIVTNGDVLTMDPSRPQAEALAMRDGILLAVGTAADIEDLRGPATRVLDAGGGTVLPGFCEAHMHLFLGAFELDHLQLDGIVGEAALARAVHAHAAAQPPGGVVMAQGAAYGILGEDRRVTRHDLDRLVADRPFALCAEDHHTVWANTAALEAAGLLHGGPMPAGAEIVMGEDGRATGELREHPAFEPIMALAGGARARLGLSTGRDPMPPATPAERAHDKALLRRGLAYCAAHGITSIHNMDGNRYTLDLLSEIEAEGGLTARVRVPFHLKPEMPSDAVEEAVALDRDFRGPRLRSGFVKLFMDGVLESWTAALLEDYADRPGARGDLLFAPERFADLATRIDRAGLQIAVHAVGDRAVRTVLDGYAAARAANGARDARHRVEHIEVVHPADIPRFAQLGVVASMQPLHRPDPARGGMEPIRSMLGPARWPHAYAVETLRAAGARVVFASDWPVSPIDPLASIAAATATTPWAPGLPHQRTQMHGALRHYTVDGAYCGFEEGVAGMLRPGFVADVTVLSPGEHAGELGTHVTTTIASGDIVHSKAAGQGTGR